MPAERGAMRPFLFLYRCSADGDLHAAVARNLSAIDRARCMASAVLLSSLPTVSVCPITTSSLTVFCGRAFQRARMSANFISDSMVRRVPPVRK